LALGQNLNHSCKLGKYFGWQMWVSLVRVNVKPKEQRINIMWLIVFDA